MLHIRLLELESELIAKEEAQRASALAELPPECHTLKEAVEREIGLQLAGFAASDWRGWLTYRRGASELVIIRGRTFKETGMFGKYRAGLDFAGGPDSIADYARHFDVSAPPDLDHLMLNFGIAHGAGSARVFLWYGENVAPYRLIFEEEMAADPEQALLNAVAEGLSWIVAKPKELTLPEFFRARSQDKR